MNSLQLTLYTTEHCALCEQALTMLFSMPELAGAELNVVDVAESDTLFQQYGERIPVVKVGAQEIDAPFDAVAFKDWLSRAQAGERS